MPVVDVLAQLYADLRRVHRQALSHAVRDEARLLEYQWLLKQHLDAGLMAYFRPVQRFEPETPTQETS